MRGAVGPDSCSQIMSIRSCVELCSQALNDDNQVHRRGEKAEDNQASVVQLSPAHYVIQVELAKDGQMKVKGKGKPTGDDKRRCIQMAINKTAHNRTLGACLHKSFPRTLLMWSYPVRKEGQYPEEPRGSGPFFFFGGTNGAEIVSAYCERRGWQRIHNKHREDFKLKWSETKSPRTYLNFREGEQLVYQIPNNKVLTTKIGLLSSLMAYERVRCKVNHGQALRKLKMEEFIPTTFRMDVKEEREAFFALQGGANNNSSQMWICKPTGLNQGRGIFLLRNLEDIGTFKLKLQRLDDLRASTKMLHRQPQAYVVQHYIQRPLLLRGKKFDVRSYLLIACTSPYMVFFRHGYVRLTCDPYEPSSNNLSDHLTNQYMQKKNPLYSQMKEDTVWSMESFNAYVNNWFQVAKALPRDWVLGAFTTCMQQIMTQCFFAVKPKLDRRLGFFDLIGCDFIVDEEFKVWLLEMNCNPALHVNCEVLKEVIPSTVEETLDLTLEIFNKCRLRQQILPLACQGSFVLLYNGHCSSDSRDNIGKGHKVSKKSPKTKPKKSHCSSSFHQRAVVTVKQ
ncbi:protein polyglycylase TTLL10 isoform X2 [Syngnathoides biaculeatus]|uniref:protein polyglycylase TTLL10 isoform X2 n=1 Tax=Syngnathoides biaculeatus TaxID=300417 RepID=UPI002ADE5690|nr:protein polyglycylase TTLL10 isoform X2 [Syngnathoides biaculeatus]